MIKIKEFKSNVFKDYKLMIFLMIFLLVCSLPLHIRTIESHPILDKNGFMAIQYQDGMLRVNDDSAAGTIFTDIGEMNKWKIIIDCSFDKIYFLNNFL